MICPLLQTLCLGKVCSWWDTGNTCCAILTVGIELIKIGENK